MWPSSAFRILDYVNASDEITAVVRTVLAHHMLEAGADPVLVLNGDDRIILASRAAMVVFGWSLPALIGRDWNDLVHPDDDGRPRLLVDAIVDSRFSGFEQDIRVLCADTLYRRVRMKAYTSWASHVGTVTVVVLHDIS